MKRITAVLIVLVMMVSVYAIAEDWICPVCGNNASKNFCNECGTPKPVDDSNWNCPVCGSEASGKFCSECGTPKQAQAQTDSPSDINSTPLGTDNMSVFAPSEQFVIERLSTVPDIAKIAAVTESNDPNGNLGKPGSYIAQVYFSSPLVNPAYAINRYIDVIDLGTKCGGSIEVYSTVEDAEKRDQYLAIFDGTVLSSGSHTVIGTMIVRTSSSLFASDQKKLESEIIAALTSEEISGGEADVIFAEPQELVTVKECGFQVVYGYLKYSFIAHNNMTDKAAYLPTFRITVRDAEGGLISTTEQTLNVIYPGQDIAYAGQGNRLDEMPAKIEISYVEPDDDWHIKSPSKLSHPTYKPFEIVSAKIKGNNIVGELYNPNDYSQSMIAISVLFRDTEGKLLGGSTSFIDNVRAGETVPFEFSISNGLITDSFEVYTQPWM